jgi:N-acetylmuramoyl-L-alanine amidase
MRPKRFPLAWILSFSLFVISCPAGQSIVIDPGHGGSGVAGSLNERSNSSPNNATTPGGLKEKDLTLEFSLILREEILKEAKRQGRKINVILTREKDVNLDFIKRAEICNRPDTACVVSIHFNAGAGPETFGSLALIAAQSRNPNYEIDSAFGAGLAEACSNGVRRFLPQSKSRGVITDGHLHGGLGSNFFFQLLRQPHLKEVPKCFLEVEFIDNATVEKALLSEDRAEKFRFIAASVAAYLVSVTDEKAKRKQN